MKLDDIMLLLIPHLNGADRQQLSNLADACKEALQPLSDSDRKFMDGIMYTLCLASCGALLMQDALRSMSQNGYETNLDELVEQALVKHASFVFETLGNRVTVEKSRRKVSKKDLTQAKPASSRVQ